MPPNINEIKTDVSTTANTTKYEYKYSTLISEHQNYKCILIDVGIFGCTYVSIFSP